MIELTLERLEKATAKARITKPLVKVIEFRKYQVTNRDTGATYEVKFSKVGSRKFGECNCKAGQAGKYACHHLIAGLSRHLAYAEQMAAV